MSEVVRVAGYSRVETPCQSDPNLFYADSDRSKQEAKKMCGTCGVRDRCFNQAKEDNESFGIWGGVDFSKPFVRDPNKCQKGLHQLPKNRENNRCDRCAKAYKKQYNAQPRVKTMREESNRKASREKKNKLGATCRSGNHVLTSANSEKRSDGALMCLECSQGKQRVRFRNDKGVRDGYGFGTSQ